MKQEQGIMDFSDLGEHLCLALLSLSLAQRMILNMPSEVAKELQDTFKEIMVDEYQDTNGVQETIINLISRIDNRFYGDVKQAIYSFRMADILCSWRNIIHAAACGRTSYRPSEEFRSHENILAANG